MAFLVILITPSGQAAFTYKRELTITNPGGSTAQDGNTSLYASIDLGRAITDGQVCEDEACSTAIDFNLHSHPGENCYADGNCMLSFTITDNIASAGNDTYWIHYNGDTRSNTDTDVRPWGFNDAVYAHYRMQETTPTDWAMGRDASAATGTAVSSDCPEGTCLAFGSGDEVTLPFSGSDIGDATICFSYELKSEAASQRLFGTGQGGANYAGCYGYDSGGGNYAIGCTADSGAELLVWDIADNVGYVHRICFSYGGSGQFLWGATNDAQLLLRDTGTNTPTGSYSDNFKICQFASFAGSTCLSETLIDEFIVWDNQITSITSLGGFMHDSNSEQLTLAYGSEQNVGGGAASITTAIDSLFLDADAGIGSVHVDLNCLGDCVAVTWYKDGASISTDINYAYDEATAGDFNFFADINVGASFATDQNTVSIGQMPQGLTCSAVSNSYWVDMNFLIAGDSTTTGTTTQYNLQNTTDSNLVAYQLDSNYFLYNTDLFDYFDYNCHICNGSYCKDTTDVSWSGTIDDNFTVRFHYGDINYTNMDVNFTDENGSQVQYLSQVTYPMSDLISRTERHINYDLNAVHASYYFQPAGVNVDVNEELEDFNVSIEPVRLILNFSQQTSGVIFTASTAQDFNDTSLVIVQTSLPQGLVHVTFNNNTQDYEYMNDWATHVDENIFVLPSNDGVINVRVTDTAGAIVPDALVRVRVFDTNYATDTNWNLYHQAYTNADGIVTLRARDLDEISVVVQKDNYTNAYFETTALDYIDSGGYLAIELDKGDYVARDGIYIIPSKTSPLWYIPQMVSLGFTSVTSEAVCFRYYKGADYNATLSRCANTSNTSYDLNVYDGNTFSVEVTIDGNTYDTYSWVYDSSYAGRGLDRASTDEEHKDNFFVFFLMVILLTGLVDYFMPGHGIGVFFLLTLSLAISGVSYYFLTHAFLASIWVLRMITEVLTKPGN